MFHYLFLDRDNKWRYSAHLEIAKKFSNKSKVIKFKGDSAKAADEVQRLNGIKPITASELKELFAQWNKENRIYCYYAIGASDVTWVGDYRSLSKDERNKLIWEAEERRYNRCIND